jgi:molecular chaperone DnaK
VEIHVLQGEAEMAAFNKTLGVFQLANITPARRGLMEFDVSFDIDANGILHVQATDIVTGNEQKIRIEGGIGLSKNEINRMMQEAEMHADEVHQLRKLADTRNLAEVIADQIELSLKAHHDKVEAADAAKIEVKIIALRKVLAGINTDEIHIHTKALTEVAQVLTKTINPIIP